MCASHDSLKELSSAVQESLDNRGAIDRIKSQIRSEMFLALQTPTFSKQSPSEDSLVINSLISQYLEYNNLYRTSSVFSAETGSYESVPAPAIASDLSIPDSGSDLPLLYQILTLLRHKNDDL
ncbi:hypothetical protein GEMRC1_002816 [Eukaryota sp. GEM-RC1]